VLIKYPSKGILNLGSFVIEAFFRAIIVYSRPI